MRELRRILGYLRPYAAQMVLAAVLLAVSGALMGAVVSAVKPLVNDVLGPAAAAAPSHAAPASPASLDRLSSARPLAEWLRGQPVLRVPALIVGLFFVRGLFLYFGQYLTVRCGASLIRDLRQALYESIVRQSLDFFQAHPTGMILSRVLYDVQAMQRLATTQLADLVRVATMVPVLLVVAMVHDWRTSLLTLAALPLLGYPMVRLGRRLRRAAGASQAFMSSVADRLAESVSGVRIVQAFGMERYETVRFARALREMFRAELRAGRAAALAPAVMELLGALVGATLFYLAGVWVAAGRLDPGDFAVVLFCLGLLFMSARRLSSVYGELQRALAAAERVFDFLDREPTVVERPGARKLTVFTRHVVFEGVRFDYGGEAVLQGIDLTIERGETVAIVGPSGSGKSTLVALLPRFYDPTSGAVRIDGHDIRDLSLVSLRSQIGLVTQETVLFDDTVRNNIAYGREDLDLDRVIEASRASQAHEFVQRLPRGYDTRIGEHGGLLSVGQRQRIAIARSLVKDPPLLILDEATSALDAESEEKVSRALERLMEGRTSIVIAHRLATVRRADRIVVLREGRIVEQGTHDMLLARGGLYARLCELQFQGPAG